jgi:hypothetical protein
MVDEERIKRLWAWIDRPLSPNFFTDKISPEEMKKRVDEIPVEFRDLAYVIYEMSLLQHKVGRDGKFPNSCLEFRIMVFDCVQELKKKNINLPLPYYWFMDGVMIEPEWIVRLTNGLVKWVCDSSKLSCGLYGSCMFSK